MNKRIFCAAAALALSGVFANEPKHDGTVDFGKAAGVIKPLNGLCGAPKLSNSKNYDRSSQIMALRTPFYRFHDDALVNPGYALVDVSRIFPLFHADPDDPRNYDFAATDDYLRPCVESGAQIDFRLGESIEHSHNTYRTHPPTDPEKWAEICAHIIRHYNAGWANGHKWNIRYWSVWEEPDNPLLMSGENSYREKYLPLYAATARRIRREFPDVFVGGPNCMSSLETATEFVEYCRKHSLPLDFFSWTHYARNPEPYFEMSKSLRKLLDDNGFAKTKLFLSEWHYCWTWSDPKDINTERKGDVWKYELTGTQSAVFIPATLSLMQDSPVDAMFYYLVDGGLFGLFETTAPFAPRGQYRAMLAFAELAKGKTRVAAETCPKPGFYVLASKDETGRGRILATAFKTGGSLRLRILGGMKPVSVKTYDEGFSYEPTDRWYWKDGVLELPHNYGDSAFWFVELEPER